MGGHELNSDYWNSRYLNNDASWDIGGISTPLKEYVDQLTNKNISILIPGAGNAYEAEYLFKQGFGNIYICDLAPAPLQNFLSRCPGFNPSHLLQEDFFKLKDQSFDLVIEQTFFCALPPDMRSAYFEKMQALLRPGGKLVGLLFNDPLNTDKPPFGGSKEEYLLYFKSLFKINTFETAYNSIKPRQGRELFINLEA